MYTCMYLYIAYAILILIEDFDVEYDIIIAILDEERMQLSNRIRT